MSTRSAADEQIIARWIEPNPHTTDPAEALVLPRCVSVWALIQLLQLADNTTACVAEAYELPPEAVQSTVRYYDLHRAAVDARIERNRAVFAS